MNGWALLFLGSMKLNRLKLLKLLYVIVFSVVMKSKFVDCSSDSLLSGRVLRVSCGCFPKSKCYKVFLHCCNSLTVSGLFADGDIDFIHCLLSDGSPTEKSYFYPLTSPMILSNFALSMVDLRGWRRID